MSARTFESNNDWYDVTREMQMGTPTADVATIDPDDVEAHEAPLEWTITYEVREAPLRAGDEVIIEIPLSFRLDHGRPYPVGTTHVKHVGDAKPGYAAAVATSTPSDNVTLASAVSNLSRLSVLGIRVEEGAIQTGDPITVRLGTREGSRLRAPSFSQRFRFATGARRDGESYRPVRTIPIVNVHGAAAAELRVIAPSTAALGEDLEIVLVPADDYNRNPAREYSGQLAIESPSFLDCPDPVDLSAVDTIARTRSRDALLDDTYVVPGRAVEEGTGRLAAIDRANGLFGRSNPIAVDWTERNVYWGDIHVQGYDSIGVGSAAEMFEWGRTAEGLDFCATANHYSGRYDVTEEVWKRVVNAANRYYDPGSYVTFVSYEWAGAYGHRNVYFKDDTGYFFGRAGSSSHFDTPETMETLWERLEAYEGDVLAFPHHPKFCGRTSWDRFHDEFQRLVEIYSAWGDSEIGGPWSVRAGLDRGHRLGFTGGTDTHKGQPGRGTHQFGKGAGKTAVYAPALTREEVFDALVERRCYATTGPRILLDVSVNGLRMGAERLAEEQDKDARSVEVRALGTRTIDSIDVIRNGEVLESVPISSDKARIEVIDDTPLGEVLEPRSHPDGRETTYYYVRVVQENQHRAWASPVWLLG